MLGANPIMRALKHHFQQRRALIVALAVDTRWFVVHFGNSFWIN